MTSTRLAESDMTAPPGPQGFGIVFVEIVALLAVELCLAWFFMAGQYLAVFAGHFLICAAYWQFIARGREPVSWRQEQIRKLLALSTVALGPFGVLGTLLTLARLRLRYLKSTPFEEWYNTLFPSTEITRPDFLHRLLVRSGTAITGNVSPFADIMAGLDDSRKRMVLSLVIDYFIPEYVPALKRGLTDQDPTIRVSAATVMATIEGRYLARGIALEGYVDKDPADILAKRALADHLDEYAYSGLLDPIRTIEMRDRAIALYQMCNTSDPEVANRIGRLQVRLDRLDEADRTYDRLLATHPDYLPALPWEIEILYRRGRFEALRHLAQTSGPLLAQGFFLPEAIRDAIEEWERLSA